MKEFTKLENFKTIRFKERYDSPVYGTTTLYFTAPPELVEDTSPEVVSATISIDFPINSQNREFESVVRISPTRKVKVESFEREYYEDYDWQDVYLSEDEILELLKIYDNEGGSYKKLIDKFYKEIYEFRSSYIGMDSMQIYNDWYIIGFYETYFDMLSSGYVSDRINDEIIQWFLSKDKPLAFLYDEWMDCDATISPDWNDMLNWIEELYDLEMTVRQAKTP